MALLRASARASADLAQVRATLHWNAMVDEAQTARALGLDPAAVTDALRVLGASGLVGYDLVQSAYFHRVLPYDLSMLDDLHPRLADARALVDGGAVTLRTIAPLDATVASGDVTYRVREESGLLRCTCPWFAKHQGERGPCKHALAAEAARGQESAP
jgi:hypothetical protein